MDPSFIPKKLWLIFVNINISLYLQNSKHLGMGIVMDFCGKHRTEDKWSPCGIRYIIHKSISLPYQKLCRKKAIQTFFRNQYITNNIVKVNTKYYRCLMVSTNQADPSCFYFRISWILMERLWFYFFHPLHLVQGLRSNNIK